MSSNLFENLTFHLEENELDTEANKDWILLAVGTLIQNQVRDSRTESVLRKAIRQAAEAGQSLEDFHGGAEEFAHQTIAGWKEKGSNAFDEEKPVSARSAWVIAPLVTAKICLLFLLVFLLNGELGQSKGLGAFLLPLVLGILGTGTIYVYQRSQLRWGFGAAIGCVAVYAIASASLTAGGLYLLAEHSTWRYSSWWMAAELLLALGLGSFFGWRLMRQVEKEEKADTYNSADQDAWLELFARQLRLRPDMSEARIREEIARVKEHCAASGQSYDYEFGHPVAYAHSLAGQRKVKPLRAYQKAILSLAGVLLYAYIILTSGNLATYWWALPLGAFLIVLGIRDIKRKRQDYHSA
ncbi:MAG: hypothetical protein Q3965_02715 [Rothia sp. (in: high G+C Gram-positive bacteria)]|nr:hypothetical protein [Rothia sp. (in: high G+C Gram-positive bacteria)]